MLKKKLLSSYTIPTIKAINAMASKKFPDILPVGSYVYRIQKYPGDIDMREDIIKCNGHKDAIKQIVREIQKITKQIEGDPNMWFADFKAGVDPAFMITTADYDPERISVQLADLHNRGILNDKDYSFMVSLVVPNPTPDQLHALEDAIRGKYILRWEPKEILSGYKVLPGRRGKNLSDAIQEPEIVKIDAWSWLDDRFVELSNFLLLHTCDAQGNKERVNIEQGDYITAIKHDLHKYMSRFYFSPFKALKRMWVLAVVFDDKKVLKKLNPLINSGMSITYQVVSDLKALKDMMKIMQNPPYDKMAIEVEEMKERLANVYEFDMEDDVYYLLNELYELLADTEYGDKRKYDPVLMMLNNLILKLSNKMNKATIDYANRTKLLPIKGKYLEL